MSKRIFLSPPHISDEASVFVQDAIKSNWIAPVGPHIDAFEEELAETLNVKHVLATNSGTSAIHLGLLSLGIGKDDEVMCSTFTFCASVNPVIYCGATPVFVDSERITWNMDPALLCEAIEDRIKKTGKKPKAIIVVHLYGMPARMDEVIQISRGYDIPVLEDAAEALGSMYKGKSAGAFGEIGILSFNGNKIVTTSGGGALFSDNLQLVKRARYLRQEAREPLHFYEHKEVGYNYRLSNILAGLGRSQLKVLQDRIRKKREVFTLYRDGLGSDACVQFQEETSEMYSNRWLTAIALKDRKRDPDLIRRNLDKENIEGRRLWKPMHLQPVFKNYPAYVNNVSEDLFNSGICLPSGTQMTEDEVSRVISVVKKSVE